MRHALLAAGFVLAAAVGARAQSTATLRGIDVYRSSVLTNEEARRRFEPRLREYVNLRNFTTAGSHEKAEDLRREMEGEARAIPGVAWAELHVSEYFTSVDHAMYAVFDVVDRADPSRLAFAPAPKGAVKDPDGLLAAWRRYVADGEAVSLRGEMSVERPNCPGFYCLWGGTPELDAAQKAFVEGAAAKGDELRRVLRVSSDGESRAAALFVLSYSTSGADVTALCREALSDSDAAVRGAALQILADIANRHAELPIALDRVLPRLDDPVFSVRGKAMGLLVPLADRDAYRPAMMPAAPRLTQLLRLSQPESRDLAFTLLGILSKKSFDRQDYASWDAWAAKAAAGRP
ncbi:MAG TPA: HEAT repeat domain-containing protein [Elusimicrobiota bacterium]|nr:HEAT repeat domain-containing protein [Elusimicrobiota bacterium]